MMPAIYLLPAIAGVFVSLQISLNNVLRKEWPILWVILISHLGGALLATLVLLAKWLGQHGGALRPSAFPGGSTPWYAYAGGACGLIIVYCVTSAVRYVPIATTLAILIGGELFTGLVLEQAGVFGLQPARFSGARVTGGLLIVLGTYLLRNR